MSKNATRFHIPIKSGQSVPLFFCSDIHLDSIHCDRKLFKSHLEEITKANGKAFIFGDLMDVMGSFGDRRLQREDVDPIFISKGRSYLDAVVDHAIEFLRPYAKNIALISRGNHESAIMKYHNTDVILRIVTALNMLPGVDIKMGGYKGWICFSFYRNNKTESCGSYWMHYHHGFGGSAPRTKGVLAIDTEVARYPKARMLVRGHTHQKWYYSSKMREQITERGRVFSDCVFYIQMGSYKDSVVGETDGWEVEKNFEPTKMGGWFVDFEVKTNDGLIHITERVVEAV
jgi:UDP-2,3-diacylglucosamine pyrophosphatase LpxH